MRAIDAEVARLVDLTADEKTYEEECRSAFAAASRQYGRRPVLFVRTSTCCSQLRSEEYILRGFFTAAGGAGSSVAASVVYPGELGDYGAAFAGGLSRILHPLELEELRAIMVPVFAQANGRESLVPRIYEETPRLAAIGELTGGNPRTAVLLFELFVRGFSGGCLRRPGGLAGLRYAAISIAARPVVGPRPNDRGHPGPQLRRRCRKTRSPRPGVLSRAQRFAAAWPAAPRAVWSRTPSCFPAESPVTASRNGSSTSGTSCVSRRGDSGRACRRWPALLEDFHTPAERGADAQWNCWAGSG